MQKIETLVMLIWTKKKHKAFTLMELMIVIVIIGILSAVGMVMFGGQSEKAKIAATKQIHSTVTRFIANTFTLCLVDNTTYKLGNVFHTCSNGVSGQLNGFSMYFQKDLGFKSPFDNNRKTVWNCDTNYGWLLSNDYAIGETCLIRDYPQTKYLRVYTNIGKDEKGNFIILKEDIYCDVCRCSGSRC